MRRCPAVCLSILVLAFVSEAAMGAPVSFSYPGAGLGTPLNLSAGGITAQFASSGDPYGFHVEPSTFGTLAGAVLVESGIPPDSALVLGISFGAALDGVSFGFALDTTGTSTLDLVTLDGPVLVGAGSTTGRVPSGDSVAEGVIAYSGAPFDELLIFDPADPAFAIGGITVSPIPEPTGWASAGLGLLALAGLRRRG